ncbi:MAG: hypothetical protein AAFZ92_02690, partial [Pseudomonadota bacterium]
MANTNIIGGNTNTASTPPPASTPTSQPPSGSFNQAAAANDQSTASTAATVFAYGETLDRRQSLISKNGQYQFLFTPKGNVHVRQLNEATGKFDTVLWRSSLNDDDMIKKDKATLGLNSHGNLIARERDGRVHYHSGLDNNAFFSPLTRLEFYNDGTWKIFNDLDGALLTELKNDNGSWQVHPYEAAYQPVEDYFKTDVSAGTNQTIKAGDNSFIKSADGRFWFTLTHSREALIWDKENNDFIKLGLTGDRLSLNKHGEMSMYDTNDNVLWTSGTGLDSGGGDDTRFTMDVSGGELRIIDLKDDNAVLFGTGEFNSHGHPEGFGDSNAVSIQQLDPNTFFAQKASSHPHMNFAEKPNHKLEGADIGEIDFDAMRERVAIYMDIATQQLGPDALKTTPKEILMMVLATHYESWQVTHDQMQAHVEINVNSQGLYNHKSLHDVSMFKELIAESSEAEVRQHIRDAALLFYQAHMGEPPATVHDAFAMFVQAQWEETHQTGTTDFAPQRATFDELKARFDNGDTSVDMDKNGKFEEEDMNNWNRQFQEVMLTGIKDEDNIKDGKLNEPDVIGIAHVRGTITAARAMLWLLQQHNPEAYNEWIKTGPSLIDFDSPTLDQDYPLFEVKWTENGKDHSAILTFDEKEDIKNRQGVGNFNAEQIMGNARAIIAWAGRLLGFYNEHNPVQYTADGKRTGLPKVEALLAQTILAYYNNMMDKGAADRQTNGENVTYTQITAFTTHNEEALTTAPTVSDFEAIQTVRNLLNLDIEPGDNAFNHYLGAITNIQETTAVAAMWATNVSNHPAHKGASVSHSQRDRVANTGESLYLMANRLGDNRSSAFIDQRRNELLNDIEKALGHIHKWKTWEVALLSAGIVVAVVAGAGLGYAAAAGSTVAAAAGAGVEAGAGEALVAEGVINGASVYSFSVGGTAYITGSMAAVNAARFAFIATAAGVGFAPGATAADIALRSYYQRVQTTAADTQFQMMSPADSGYDESQPHFSGIEMIQGINFAKTAMIYLKDGEQEYDGKTGATAAAHYLYDKLVERNSSGTLKRTVGAADVALAFLPESEQRQIEQIVNELKASPSEDDLTSALNAMDDTPPDKRLALEYLLWMPSDLAADFAIDIVNRFGNGKMAELYSDMVKHNDLSNGQSGLERA